jgi:signal peptidase complex subunit 2
MSQPQKVPLYSLPDLKSAIDTTIPTLLTSLPKPYTLTQSHLYTNVRLALGYSAVLIAGALFYLDYRHGWDVTKPYTLPACVLYFLLNGALTLWVYVFEKSLIFSGRREGGQKLTLRSYVEKPKPEYILGIEYASPDGGKKWQDVNVAVPFAKLFSVQGYLQKAELRKWLAREVEVVGMALPEEARKPMEWEREQGVVMGVDVGEGKVEGLQQGLLEGDTIEVQTPEGKEEGLSTAMNTRARSKTPEPGSVSPTKRGPGRPKKKA